MGKKKVEKVPTQPIAVLDAQKALVIAYVNAASVKLGAVMREAMDAAELGRFDEVGELMQVLKNGLGEVQNEAKRFAPDKDESSAKEDSRKKRSHHHDDPDDDEDY